MLLRFLTIAALVFSVSGCTAADLLKRSVFDGGLSVTATVQNPVTREMQAGVELAYGLAATGIVHYARLPRCKAGQIESVTAPCSRWSVVQKLQQGNRVAYGAIVRLRAFMDANQQVSAIGAFNAAQAALRDLRAVAYIHGIKTD